MRIEDTRWGGWLFPVANVFLLVALLLSGGEARAEWVRATGQSLVEFGDEQQALARAKDEALREAAFRRQARVASEETVENGVLTDSRLTVSSEARARDVRIISERFEGDYALVTIEADMVESGLCEGSAAQGLRKRVAVSGFPLVHPSGAELGSLYDAERMLPEYLYQRLLAGDSVEPLAITQRQLYTDVRNAPTVAEADNALHRSSALAQELDVQFVVSGVIRDLGPVDPGAWGTSILDGWKRGLGVGNRDRRFALDLVVHDGFSGSPIMERRYQTHAEWNAAKTASIGFMSPGFLQTAYGQAVKTLLDQAASEIGSELRCQPFMTRISRVDGDQIYVNAGAASGLRPGQAMSIYRRFEFLDAPGSGYELQPTQTQLEIDQVHPEFARGRLPVQAGQRNIQKEDVAIIW